MRSLVLVIGAFMVLAGLIWLLQGIGILPGSFMTGQVRWALYGAAAIVIGLLVIAWSRRSPRA